MKGKSIRKLVKRNIAIGLLISMISNIGFSDIIVDKNVQQNTSVDRAQNGSQIININTPNSRGISVNDFKEFRTKDPTVFNNFGSGVGRSYLAGMMAANPNLTKEQAARLILNRVGGNNRVEIENWLEVMSENKVDLIFSSKNGFYLNQTGFINFDKAIFTTSNVNLDANGNLLPFNIRGGRIDIGRDGINAEGLRYLAFLSKQINIDGQVYAKDADLDVIAGEFDYNPNTREYTNQGTNNNELLISSSAFGSMYGNQIKVVVNSGNIGVQGDLISYKVLKINADGTVETNQIQGNEGIDVKAKEFTQNTSIYTEGNIKIDADKTILKGNGTQGNNIEITGKLDNQTSIYGKGNVTIGNNVNSTGQVISEKNLNIQGNLETSNLLYGKENINITGYLFNTSDMQSEGNIVIGSNVTNKGKILTDNILHVSGTTINEGTLYGKNRINLQGLTNSGSIQTAGDVLALNVLNTGKLISEGNISILDLVNQNELITNKALTTNNLTNTGTLSTGEGITSNGSVINHGELKTNGNFSILGNLSNYNLLNTGGLLNTRDLINHGNLKAVEKILTRGTTFYNHGEILTSNLDVDSTNILNTNKITVIENAKLKGNNITNQGQLSGTNIELITSVLTNSNQIIADGIITANNTSLTNTGYIGSNGKLVLSGSNISNQGSLESNVIEMYNLFGYNNNTGSIKGNRVYLSTMGNIDLRGLLHGESDLRVAGYGIWNNGETTGTGYIEVKGHDIINNTELASDSVVIEGTGTVTNNSIITGTNGNISGYNIINNDLIAFSEQLGIRVTDKLTNNAGKSIFAGELLDINFNTLENLRGELLSQGTIRLTGNYLLNKVGTIQANEDIIMNVTKIDNIGEVTGLDDYEIYYETWDGRILTEAEVMSVWKNEQAGENKSNKLQGLYINGLLAALDNPEYQFLLANIFLEDLWELDPTATDYKHFRQGAVEGYFDRYPMSNGTYVRTGSAQFPGIPLKGKLKSNAVTTHANISSGRDITINTTELNNMDAKISAGNEARLTAGIIKNQTTIGDSVQLKDGVEYYKQEHYGSGSDRKYHVKYWRGIENGDIAYVSGQASVIEGRSVIINTGNLILTPELETGSQIITGSTTSGTSIGGKTTNSGVSNGTGIINIEKNIGLISEIKTTGVLPINPLGAQSSLFGYSKDPTSKYLLETRGQYINIGDFYGSDYYLSKIGYDENSDWNRARRLGDAYYEYLLVTRAISDKLGTRFINGLSDKELMKAMLDNSVELQKDLQLTVGVSLTPDQVKALKSDVIWYEYEVVNGENVLVPKVYLSQTTLATIETDGRDRIGGLELTAITADELRNNSQLIGNGGVTYINAGRVYNVTDTNQLSEIRGNQVSIKATEGNIENIGGKIKGIESVSLTAENGDIINSSSKVTTRQYTDSRNNTEHESILSVGSIESEGITYIEGKNYTSESGKVSGKTTVIKAEENITIGSIELKGSDKSGSSEDNYADYDSVRKIGSRVTGTENVVLEAGKDITVKGSTVISDGTVQLTAENINIVNEKESVKKESKLTDNGTFSSYSKEEKSYQENVVGSTLAGNNVILDAKNDINIKSSNLIALKNDENEGGHISAKAGNNINVLVDTLDNSYSLKEKSSGFSSSFNSGGGGLNAGVSYSKNSLEQQRNGTTVSTSTLISEGSTMLDAGNKIRTEAMQADIGENLVIKGKNGVDLLDAQEVYEEKVKQKTTTVGVSVSIGSTVTSFIDQANGMYNQRDKYGTGNPSQLINSAGDGLTLFRSGVSAFNDGQAIFDKLATGIHPANALAGISANASLSFSQSKYESNTSGTNSVAGTIKVGNNFIIQSDGDVKLVNQKVTVGDNFVVDAKNFEGRAGENTYNNDTKSSSVGGNIGYDFASQTMTGGANVGGGNSNTSSKTYDNTVINVGGTFQLTTKEDALFAGANVTADKINFDIGRDLSIISLQDEYKSEGKNYGAGLGYSEKNTTTNQTQVGSITGNLSYGQNNSESKWVSDQTSIIANNGGNIKVDGTLTNVGSIIGSLSNENKLSIEANKVVVENLSDYNRGENVGANIGGIGLNNGTPIGQTGIQYGSHDKEQSSNATFVNTEVTEAGKKLNLEEMGINIDISKAQVVTKDEVVEQIDTNLHTDLLNTKTRKQLADDVKKAGEGLADIGASLSSDKQRYEEAREGRYSQYYKEQNPEFADFLKNPDKKSPEEMEKLTKDYVKYMTGKDVDVIITATGEGSGYIRGDQLGEGKKDVFVWDLSQLAAGGDASEIIGHEVNHIDDHRRDRESHNETDSNSFGERFKENLGEDGKSNGFDLEKWLSQGNNSEKLANNETKLIGDYGDYEIERIQVNDQGLYRAKEELKKCGSMGCVDKWNKIIYNIEISLKRTTVEVKREKVSSDKKQSTCGSKCRAKKERELAELKAKDEKLKKEYVFTEEDRKLQQTNSDYEYISSKKNKLELDNLLKETQINGLPENTIIIVKDETGKEIKYNNFDEYYYSKSPQEKLELDRLSAINNELGKQLTNAKTSAEKKKIEKKLEENQKKMNDIVYTKMTYNELSTGKSLVESALSYKDGVLVVDKNKMLGEVEKAGSAMVAEVGRIEGGASQQTVQDLKNKYGTSKVSGNDQVPKGDTYKDYSVNDNMATKKIEVTTDLEDHLKNRQMIDPKTGNTYSNKKGVVGAHNLNEFTKNDIKIVKAEKVYDVYGNEVKWAKNIKYNVQELDKTGKAINGKYGVKIHEKTTYDPKLITDSEYANRGVEAANNALKDGKLGREWTGIDSQGVKWRGYYENGKITSFYPSN